MEQPQQARTSPGPTGPVSRPKDSGGTATWFRALGAVSLLAVGILVGGAAAHFGLERPALEAAQARLEAAELDLAAMRHRLEQANTRTIALEGELLVEESTRRGLETALRSTQESLGRAQDTVAFYEQLMPPGPKGAITIRALDMEQVGPHLNYRLLLMRSGNNDKPFQGRLQFVAEGVLDDEKVSLPLVPAADPPVNQEAEPEDNDLLSVEFANFQRGSGVLVVPAGFSPSAVTVNVLEGTNIRATRRLELGVSK